MEKIIQVSKERENEFIEKINKLQIKCLKLKMKPLEVIKGKISYQKIDEITASEIIKYTIIGHMPKVDGYSFLAKIDHQPTGNIILGSLPDGSNLYKTYSQITPNCNHCKVNRDRKNTFLFQENNTDKIIQIGSTCLKDFFGHDIDDLFFYAELNDIFDNMEDFFGGCGGGSLIKTSYFLEVCCSLILENGYTSRKQSEEQMIPSTCDSVLNILNSKTGKDISITKEATELQNDIKTFFEAYEPQNDYTYNIKTLIGKEYLDLRYAGIVASAYLPFKKAKEIKNDGINSNFIGSINEKLNFELVLCSIRNFETIYGTTWLYSFKDKTNNVIIWKASKKQDIHENTTVNLKGTIKAHNEYKGVKQTVLTRCKIA